MAFCVSFEDENWVSQCNNFTLENNILNLMAATTLSTTIIFEYHPSLSFNNQADNLLADQAG